MLAPTVPYSCSNANGEADGDLHVTGQDGRNGLHARIRSRKSALRPGLMTRIGFRSGQFAPFRPSWHPVDTSTRPVQQLRFGELVEHEFVQPVPYAAVLPLAQPTPRGMPGTAPQLLGQGSPAAAGVEHEQISFSATRASIRGRQPGPWTA
jgi:hypothetical protein